jgi:Transcriptional regulatory protein, C terminal
VRYRFGDYLFDTERYELQRAGVLVPLRPKECDVLAYLLAHRDRVVSKDELLEQVWPGQFVGDATLHVRILAVRKALGDDSTTARRPATHGARARLPLCGTSGGRGLSSVRDGRLVACSADGEDARRRPTTDCDDGRTRRDRYLPLYAWFCRHRGAQDGDGTLWGASRGR